MRFKTAPVPIHYMPSQALYICCVPSSSGAICVVCNEITSDPHPTAARPPSAHSSLPMRCQRPRRGRPASWNGLSLWCFSVLAGREKAVTWSECCTAVAAATPRGVAGKGWRTDQATTQTWCLPMVPPPLQTSLTFPTQLSCSAWLEGSDSTSWQTRLFQQIFSST